MTSTIPFRRLMLWHVLALVPGILLGLYALHTWDAFQRAEIRLKSYQPHSRVMPRHLEVDSSVSIRLERSGVPHDSSSEESQPPKFRGSVMNRLQGSRPAPARSMEGARGLNLDVGTLAVKSGSEVKPSHLESDSPKLGTLSLAMSEALETPKSHFQGPPGSVPSSVQGGLAAGLSFDPVPTYKALADNAAMLCGVDSDRFARLIRRESEWKSDAVSIHGARGLGQLKPTTLREFDHRLRIDVPWDNLIGAACVWRAHYGRVRPRMSEQAAWEEATMSYVAGPWRKGTTPETRAYARAILGGSR